MPTLLPGELRTKRSTAVVQTVTASVTVWLRETRPGVAERPEADVPVRALALGANTGYIAGFFRGHLFSRISRISAGRENIFREILGATPSSRSAPTWVWSGFGLIAKIFFAKSLPLAIHEKIGPRKNPAIRYILASHTPPLKAEEGRGTSSLPLVSMECNYYVN